MQRMFLPQQPRDSQRIIQAIKQYSIDAGYAHPMSKIKKLDRIEVPLGEHQSINLLTEKQMELLRQLPAISSMPFLEEGAIRLVPQDANTNQHVWVHFRILDADVAAKTFTIHYTAYGSVSATEYRYMFYTSWDAHITAPGAMADGCTMAVTDITRWEGLLGEMQKLPAYSHITPTEWIAANAGQQKIYPDDPDGRKLCEETTKTASAVFSQLNFLMLQEQPEKTVETQNPTQPPKPQKPQPAIKQAKAPKTGPKTILLGGAKVTIRPGSTAKVKGRRITNRYTDRWDVRGHFRHYRNGKTIWVQPYEKGPGKNKPSPKRQKIYKAVKPNEKA